MGRFFIIPLIFFSLSSIPSSPALASSGQALLTDLSVSASLSVETIELLFANPFDQTPSLNFETGMVRVTLPKTDFKQKLSYRTVNDRFIQAIRLVKEGKNSLLEIQFSASDFEPINKIRYTTQKTKLTIVIDKKAHLGETSPADANSQRSRDAKSGSLVPAGDYFAGDTITSNIVKMLLALVALLLFFYLLLWVYNKFFLSKFSFNKGKYSIKVTSSYHISPKQKIMIVEINDVAFACSVTSQNFNVISKISDTSFVDYLTNLPPSQWEKVSFSDLRTEYLEKKKTNRTAKRRTKTTNRSFSFELIERVKKLRPLD